jgi:carnitine O-acetyltransferase
MREHLKADKTNAESFQEIENTLFCVCLDDSSPASDQEMSMLTFIGNGHNRYYDRNFQMISYANGQMCVNAEHTWADALIVSDLFDHINETADELMKKSAAAASKSLPDELMPKRLCWVMSATTGEGLERAKEHYIQLRDSIDLCAYKFNAFGKTAIAKSFGLSPDAFIQMAMQLAHLRLHKKVVLTYESSHTRRFWHGRTEAVRSASSKSTAFAKAMDALVQSDDRDTKKYLLQQACEAHVNTIKQNMAGQGFDRHLLMLKAISMHQKQPLPEIYRDKVPLFRTPKAALPKRSHHLATAGLDAGFRAVHLPNSFAERLWRRLRSCGCTRVRLCSPRPSATRDLVRLTFQ